LISENKLPKIWAAKMSPENIKSLNFSNDISWFEKGEDHKDEVVWEHVIEALFWFHICFFGVKNCSL
jgi:hypothetical protein